MNKRAFDLEHDAELYQLEVKFAMCRLGGAIIENVCRQYAGAANVQSALAAILEQALTHAKQLDEVDVQLGKLTEENERLRASLDEIMEYDGGADNALEDEYLQLRSDPIALQAFRDARGKKWREYNALLAQIRNKVLSLNHPQRSQRHQPYKG